MVKCFDILRTDGGKTKPYRQKIVYDRLEENDTVATALQKMNEDSDLRDVDGNTVREIVWDCSCLQKKCGACAMRIDGLPVLACSVKLAKKDGTIVLEPLRKFPVVADLKVDRSALHEYLLQMETWTDGTAGNRERQQDVMYESSRCLQCGCCLEVCPNFYVGGTFAGMAAMVPTVRAMSGSSSEKKKSLKKAYRARIYEGCGKSLACKKICPAQIDMENLLVRSNAMAVWQILKKRRRDCD